MSRSPINHRTARYASVKSAMYWTKRISAEKDDAGAREGGADESRGKHSRHARDEEDLRVDVVGEGNRPIEYACQADRRAAHERRQQARGHEQRSEAADREREPRADGRSRRP